MYDSGISRCHYRHAQAELASSGRVNLSSVDFIIINVGTNNVSSSQPVNTILSYYGDLIYKLKRIIRAKLIFTSILPKLVDHRDSESKVCKVFDFWFLVF